MRVAAAVTLASLALGVVGCSDSTTSPSEPAADAGASFATTGTIVGSVKATPDSASIAVGGTVTLSAATYDLNGKPTGKVVNFLSRNTAIATVTSSGVVKGVASGRVWIKEGAYQYKPDSTLIVVGGTTTSPTPSPTPTPTPAPSTSGTNEPAGFSLITSRDWSTKAATTSDRAGAQGWDPIEGKYGNLTIVSDASAPFSASKVAQMKYPAGMTAGRAPGLAQIAYSTPRKQMYVSFYAKVSPTFSGNQSNTNKTIFLWLAGAGNRVFLSMEGGYMNPLYWTVRYQASTTSGANPAPRLGHVNKSAALVTRGQWQKIELLQTVGTPGGKNSTVRLWVNGVLVTTADNVDLIGPSETNITGFNQVQWSPTFGGGGASVPYDMYLWFDHLYASGK